MTYDSAIHHRRSLRLKDRDYTQPGAYFITIVSHHRQEICLHDDEFVVVPNYMHAIVWMLDPHCFSNPASSEFEEMQASRSFNKPSEIA